MTGKHYNLYLTAFRALSDICFNYGMKLRPRIIMMDFEKGMRNAVLKVFPTAKLLGCFFHYAKCLWFWASKHGLRTKNNIDQTKRIILLMKILPHLSKENKLELLKEIKILFKENPFADFLKYWEKNWFDFDIDPTEDIEGNDKLVRTNNIVEVYNRMKFKIGVNHPRSSFGKKQKINMF